MKKMDIIIVVIALVVAIGGFFGIKAFQNRNFSEKYLEISVDGKVYKQVDVTDKNHSEEIEIKNDHGTNIIKVENGGAYMEEADCQDKVCVKSGFIDKVGETIVCLPHKLIVEVKGIQNNDVDVTAK